MTTAQIYMSDITLRIPGIARTKGSFFPIKTRSGALFLANSDKHLAEWTNLIKMAWIGWCEAHRGAGETPAGELPPPRRHAFELSVTCEFARPKRHFGTGRNEGKIKQSAPSKNDLTRKPDCDKVLRAVLDSLEGLIWKNDAQVVACTMRKCWGDKDMTTLIISNLIQTE